MASYFFNLLSHQILNIKCYLSSQSKITFIFCDFQSKNKNPIERLPAFFSSTSFPQITCIVFFENGGVSKSTALILLENTLKEKSIPTLKENEKFLYKSIYSTIKAYNTIVTMNAQLIFSNSNQKVHIRQQCINNFTFITKEKPKDFINTHTKNHCSRIV